MSELVELQFRVRNVRREIAERRALEKAEDKAEAAAKRKAVSWCYLHVVRPELSPRQQPQLAVLMQNA